MTLPAQLIHLYVQGPTPTTMHTACGATLTPGQAWRATTYRLSATCPACQQAEVIGTALCERYDASGNVVQSGETCPPLAATTRGAPDDRRHS